ncbi:TonB-dependent receptor plug domain-containing protein [Leptobacterium sp. I13]|uniref:TonB-dependent receptor plug domain-containing protein n=1 Tax=Leptobacterium meishanense TaxID=3128904 RepID=UPI0030EDBFBA
MNKRVIILEIFVFLCKLASAQEPSKNNKKVEELDEVVVADSRFELKREHSGKTVIKITAEELERNQGKSVAEIINTKSGFEINGSRSNAGQNLSYFVRGGNNRQVLIMIDGIQVSDPSQIANDYDLRLLSVSQIESIEIVKGAASTLYGNAAATAVINIQTKNPSEEKIALTLQSSIGTNQPQEEKKYTPTDFSNSLSLSGTTGKFNYVAGFSQQYTDGLSAVVDTNNERDPFSRLNAQVKLGYTFNDYFTLKTYGNYDTFKAHFDNSFPVMDADFSSDSEQFRFGIASKYIYKNGSINLNAAFNKIDRVFESDFPGTFNGKSYVADVFNKYNFNDKFYTILGVNYINNQTDFGGNDNYSSVGPYANVVWISDFGLNLNTGIRLNNHSEYGSHVTYNFNPSYTFRLESDYLKLLTSYSTSYIAPSLSQLFGPFGPNPDLKPEENRTVEGGVEYHSEKVKWSAVYFNREEMNFIDFVVIDFNTFAGAYQNVIEDFTVEGVELELVTEPFLGASFTANYTFTEQKDRASLRLPKHSANVNFGYQVSKKAYASLSYRYTGTRLDTNFETFETNELTAFSLVGTYISYQVIQDRLKTFFSFDNIFNEKYEEVIGFSSRGRNIRVGFSLLL